MQIRSILLAAVASLGATFASSTAFAAAWMPPSGGNASFTYVNGGDDNGLFGSPTVNTTGFTFTPANFVASSANGQAAITSDRLHVNVDSASGGKTITGVSLGEIGDYTIFGTGGVKAFAFMVVNVLDATYGTSSTPRAFSATMMTTPTFPVSTTTSADGSWTGKLLVNLPFPAAHIQIVLNNTLQTTTGTGGSALIQKKLLATSDGTGPGIGILTTTPEPATLGVVVGGLIVLARRRRA